MKHVPDFAAELKTLADECAAVAAPVKQEPLKSVVERLQKAISEIDEASSGSWIGYHAYVYYAGFRRPRPGDHFDSEWGLADTFTQHVSENWREVDSDDVHRTIFAKAGEPDTSQFEALADKAADIFNEKKSQLLTILSVLMDAMPSRHLEEIRDEVKKLKVYSASDVVNGMAPSGWYSSRDSTAMSQGMRTPHHIQDLAWLTSHQRSYTAADQLGKAAIKTLDYITKLRAAKPSVDAPIALPTTGTHKVFIGHGHSPLWKELKDFLQDRLHLSWEEFNRESAAGKSTKERLEEMLATSTFAFLVMTAEDEHADATMHARENVIHEVGLFQGKLGFTRAIIILESGCQEFTNIVGIGQIRFPKGSINGAFEEIRKVLEREGIIKPT